MSEEFEPIAEDDGPEDLNVHYFDGDIKDLNNDPANFDGGKIHVVMTPSKTLFANHCFKCISAVDVRFRVMGWTIDHEGEDVLNGWNGKIAVSSGVCSNHNDWE